jgi:hypothetical protein
MLISSLFSLLGTLKLVLCIVELKSRKENANNIMPDLAIDMHSNPFGDQDDLNINFGQTSADKNFDQISVNKKNSIFIFEI